MQEEASIFRSWPQKLIKSDQLALISSLDTYKVVFCVCLGVVFYFYCVVGINWPMVASEDMVPAVI